MNLRNSVDLQRQIFPTIWVEDLNGTPIPRTKQQKILWEVTLDRYAKRIMKNHTDNKMTEVESGAVHLLHSLLLWGHFNEKAKDPEKEFEEMFNKRHAEAFHAITPAFKDIEPYDVLLELGDTSEVLLDFMADKEYVEVMVPEGYGLGTRYFHVETIEEAKAELVKTYPWGLLNAPDGEVQFTEQQLQEMLACIKSYNPKA